MRLMMSKPSWCSYLLLFSAASLAWFGEDHVYVYMRAQNKCCLLSGAITFSSCLPPLLHHLQQEAASRRRTISFCFTAASLDLLLQSLAGFSISAESRFERANLIARANIDEAIRRRRIERKKSRRLVVEIKNRFQTSITLSSLPSYR